MFIVKKWCEACGRKMTIVDSHEVRGRLHFHWVCEECLERPADNVRRPKEVVGEAEHSL